MCEIPTKTLNSFFNWHLPQHCQLPKVHSTDWLSANFWNRKSDCLGTFQTHEVKQLPSTHSRPTVGQQSADRLPTVSQQITNSRPTVGEGSCSSQLPTCVPHEIVFDELSQYRLMIGQFLLLGYHKLICRLLANFLLISSFQILFLCF